MERSIEEIYELYQKYCNSLKHSNRFFVDEEIHRFFDKIIENNTIEINKDEILYRARINNEGNTAPFRGKDIGMPPKEVLSLGRANPYGINYLYLATDVETVIGEVRPKNGDYLTIGRFKVKNTIKVIKLSRVATGGGTIGDKPTANETSNFMIFLSNEFRKPIDKFKELEYLPMQYFTEYCKSKGINGVKFLSSVMNSNLNEHFNITLFDDRDIDYMDSEVQHIKEIKYVSEKIQYQI